MRTADWSTARARAPHRPARAAPSASALSSAVASPSFNHPGTSCGARLRSARARIRARGRDRALSDRRARRASAPGSRRRMRRLPMRRSRDVAELLRGGGSPARRVRIDAERLSDAPVRVVQRVERLRSERLFLPSNDTVKCARLPRSCDPARPPRGATGPASLRSHPTGPPWSSAWSSRIAPAASPRSMDEPAGSSRARTAYCRAPARARLRPSRRSRALRGGRPPTRPDGVVHSSGRRRARRGTSRRHRARGRRSAHRTPRVRGARRGDRPARLRGAHTSTATTARRRQSPTSEIFTGRIIGVAVIVF